MTVAHTSHAANKQVAEPGRDAPPRFFTIEAASLRVVALTMQAAPAVPGPR